MPARLLLSAVFALLRSQAAQAQDACKEDKDCGSGKCDVSAGDCK